MPVMDAIEPVVDEADLPPRLPRERGPELVSCRAREQNFVRADAGSGRGGTMTSVRKNENDLGIYAVERLDAAARRHGLRPPPSGRCKGQ